MTECSIDDGTLHALADEGNGTARDHLAGPAEAGDGPDGPPDLTDEGSGHAGRLPTRRAVERRDLRELQRPRAAGLGGIGADLERLLGEGKQS